MPYFLSPVLGQGDNWSVVEWQQIRTEDSQMASLSLTPPSRTVFIISVFLAILALLVRYAHAAIPVVSNYTFETCWSLFCCSWQETYFAGFNLPALPWPS